MVSHDKLTVLLNTLKVTRPKKSKKFKKPPKKKLLLKKNGECCRLTLAQKAEKRMKKLQGRINRQIKIFA